MNLRNRIFPLLLSSFCFSYSFSQTAALVSPDDETLLQKVTKGKRNIDWANMNIQFCTSADAEFRNGTFKDAAFKVNRVRLEVLGAFGNKFSYHFRQSSINIQTPIYLWITLQGLWKWQW